MLNRVINGAEQLENIDFLNYTWFKYTNRQKLRLVN